MPTRIQAARLNLQAVAPGILAGTGLATRFPNNSLILAGRATRPLWFDGRFLSACDLQREQNFFLRKQAHLGKAAGFGVLHGLTVDQGAANTQPASAETIVIRAGVGINPCGELVMIPSDLTIELSDLADEENLEVQFGLSQTPQQPGRTRTGLYVVALRPVQFTANPISSYPASLQAPRITHDGDIVEATAVSLVPFPNPVNNYDASLQQAALAWQIFVAGNAGPLSDSLLPLAMISIDRNAIQWIDMYLVRRDSGPQPAAVQLGLADPATQQAFLMQYDARLQAVTAPFLAAQTNAYFAATDYFQALPSAARFPLGAINTANLTQVFFPPQMDVQLSLIPADELPAVLQDGMSLPAIDLTLAANAYANLSVLALVPIARNNFAAVRSTVQDTRLAPALPQALPIRTPLQRFSLVPAPVSTAAPVSGSAWAAAMKGLTYGFYLLLRNEPIFVDFTSPSLPAPLVTPAPALRQVAPTVPAPAVTALLAKSQILKPAPTTTAAPAPTTTPVAAKPAAKTRTLKTPPTTTARPGSTPST